jgi:uncharacterized protein
LTVAAGLAALLGAFVGSATGFGFALVLSPVLFSVVEPLEAIYILLVLSLVLNALVLFEGGLPLHVNWRRLLPLLLAALPGLAAGAALLLVLDKQTLQVTVGVAVIAAGAWQLRSRTRGERRRRPLPPVASLAVGFTSGMLTTSLSVSGPPIVLWLEAHGVRPAEFRATLAASFLALSVAGGALFLVAEGTAGLDLGLLPLLLVLVVAGYFLGAVAFQRSDHERFFVLALGLVVLTGAGSVLAGLGVL